MAYKTEAELHELNFSLDRDDDESIQLIDMMISDEMDGEHTILMREALEAGYDSILEYLAAQ